MYTLYSIYYQYTYVYTIPCILSVAKTLIVKIGQKNKLWYFKVWQKWPIIGNNSTI